MSSHKQPHDRIRLGERLDALKALQRDYENKRVEAARSGEVCLQNGQLPEYLKCKVEESYWRYFKHAVTIRIRQAEKALKRDEDIGAKYGGAIAVTIVVGMVLIVSLIVVNLNLYSIQQAAGFSSSHLGTYAAVITVALIGMIGIAGWAIIAKFVAMGRKAGAKAGRIRYRWRWGRNDLGDFPQSRLPEPSDAEVNSNASEKEKNSAEA